MNWYDPSDGGLQSAGAVVYNNHWRQRYSYTGNGLDNQTQAFGDGHVETIGRESSGWCRFESGWPSYPNLLQVP